MKFHTFWWYAHLLEYQLRQICPPRERGLTAKIVFYRVIFSVNFRALWGRQGALIDVRPV